MNNNVLRCVEVACFAPTFPSRIRGYTHAISHKYNSFFLFNKSLVGIFTNVPSSSCGLLYFPMRKTIFVKR